MTSQSTLPAVERAEAPPPAALAPPAVSSARLVATMALAGALSGLLLMGAFRTTQPAILAHKEQVLREAVTEVLGGPPRFETLYVLEDRLVAEPPAGADPRALERVHLGFDAEDRPVGFAVSAAQPGFQDVIRLIYGFDPRTGRLLGLRVLESKETPGLGDKIEKQERFRGQFVGREPPLVGVKQGSAGDRPEAVDTITGATISSRAVVRIVNDSVARLGPRLARHLREASR